MSIINRTIAVLGVCMALGGTAAASGDDGPFSDVFGLLSYWSGRSTNGFAVQIFVDGFLDYDRLGFGPALIKQYFSCSSDIRPACSNLNAGSSSTSYLITTFGSGMNVYIDNIPVQTGGSLTRMDIKTCHGNQSLVGAVTYYVVATWTNGFGPPYVGQDCFQLQ